MLFNSYIFIFIFLPAVLIGWYGLNKLQKYELAKVFLTGMSLWFYGYFNTYYLFIIIASILINYLISYLLTFCKTRRANQFGLFAGVAANLAILFYFKYYDFFIENINYVFRADFNLKHILLPLGISFFTFQQLSFIIDRCTGKTEHYSFINYAAFVTFFPQLIAGPIVLYKEIIPQFDDLSRRNFDISSFARGISLFVIGLSKKVLLADVLALVTNFGFEQTYFLDSPSTLLVILSYTFQIYFDFSGYSDMATGLGKMLGFEFKKNFFYPYVSTSITEFWRRWHISLSTWFRDYVYIPLGGNRVSKRTHVRNIMVVWMLTGLWHGAAWNFVIWGVYYGILLLIEKYILADVLEKIPAAVRHIYCLALVMIGWVFFFSPTLGSAVDYLKLMVGVEGHGFIDRQGLYILMTNGWMWVMLALSSTPAVHDFYEGFIYSKGQAKMKAAANCLIYAILFLLCVAYLVTESYNPFLYFRF